MHIRLKDIAQKFGKEFIFRGLSADFKPGSKTAVLGGNGSGKSTLLKIIYGAQTPTEGTASCFDKEGKRIHQDKVPFYIQLSGPYYELIEELSVLDFLNTYQKFRPFRDSFSSTKIIETAMLEHRAKAPIKNLSSGMRQRLKLALALCAKADVVMLDEPTSNLDPEGVTWFQHLLQSELNERSLFIGSNFNTDEIFMCSNQLELKDYKQL